MQLLINVVLLLLNYVFHNLYCRLFLFSGPDTTALFNYNLLFYYELQQETLTWH